MLLSSFRISKGTTDPAEGWVQLTKVTCLGRITNSNTNLDQNIKISTKHQHLVSNCWEISGGVSDKGSQCWQLNQLFSNAENLFTTKKLPELQLQNLDQTLCSKYEQKFSFITKPQLPNLQQTVAYTILFSNISNSNNINKFWVGIFTRQGHINQVHQTGVS